MGLLSSLFASPIFETTIGTKIVEVHVIEGRRLGRLRADAMLMPVSGDLWIGGPVGRLVRDASGDLIQDVVNPHAPLAPTKAIAVKTIRGSCRHLILTNIYDDNKLTNESLMREGFGAGFALVAELSAMSVVIPDFTEEFNYFEHRADADVAAKAVVNAIVANQQVRFRVSVAAFDRSSAERYIAALRSVLAEG